MSMLQYIKKKNMSPTSTTNYELLPSTPSIAIAAEGGAAGPTRERAGLEVRTKDEGPANTDKELDGTAGTPAYRVSLTS
jgi:hypothetical protein